MGGANGTSTLRSWTASLTRQPSCNDVVEVERSARHDITGSSEKDRLVRGGVPCRHGHLAMGRHDGSLMATFELLDGRRSDDRPPANRDGSSAIGAPPDLPGRAPGGRASHLGKIQTAQLGGYSGADRDWLRSPIAPPYQHGRGALPLAGMLVPEPRCSSRSVGNLLAKDAKCRWQTMEALESSFGERSSGKNSLRMKEDAAYFFGDDRADAPRRCRVRLQFERNRLAIPESCSNGSMRTNSAFCEAPERTPP